MSNAQRPLGVQGAQGDQVHSIWLSVRCGQPSLRQLSACMKIFLPHRVLRIDAQQTARSLFAKVKNPPHSLIQMLEKLGSNHGRMGKDRKPHLLIPLQTNPSIDLTLETLCYVARCAL